MVKKYHMRNSCIKQTSSRSGHAKQQDVQQTSHQIQVAEEQRVHDNGIMRTTKQDGDEDSFESTEVSVLRQPNLAMKFRRSVKRHLPKSTSRRIKQKVTNNTKHGIRSAQKQRRNSPESLR